MSVTESDCAKGMKSASGGTQTFQVQNKSGKVGEVNLVNNAAASSAKSRRSDRGPRLK